mgnify:CR=1 FL=1
MCSSDLKNIDIILLGDSFVHGSCVEDKNTIAEIIRKKFPNTLNLGFSASDPLLQYAILKEYGKLISPKLIIWFYFEGNDQIELEKTINSNYSKYLGNNFTSNLVNRQSEIDRFVLNKLNKSFSQKTFVKKDNQIKEFLKQRVTFYDIRFFFENRYLGYKEYKRLESFNGYKINSNFYKIINKFEKKANELNSKILFIYLPDWSRFKLKKEENYHGRIEVINYIKKRNIKFLDMTEIFNKEENPLILFDSDKFNAHYSEFGYQIVSESLLDFLKKVK